MKVIGIGVNWRRAAAAAVFALSLGLCALAGQTQADRLPVSGQTDSTELICQQTLAAFGWEASELISREEVRLPRVFDESYREFLRFQTEAGLPLASCAGQTVTRCTYRIENYPTGERDVFADLFVRRQEVVGGDIRTASLNGFMTGLVRPDSSS